MKKLIIAGATSVALAAMPVMGVFADGDPAPDPADVQDTLTINVNGACTFTRAGSGQYTQTMTANDIKNDFGSSTFTSECNNGKGYAVTADFTDIAHTGGTSEGASIVYDAAAALSAGAGKWQAYRSTGTAGNISDGGIAYETFAPDAPTSSFTVEYKVATNVTQSMGTYTGTATYTLAQKTQ